MEFDNRIRLKETGHIETPSGLSPEDMHRHVWELCSDVSARVGDAGNGEFWLDFSDALRTRHLVVNLSVPEPGPDGIRVYGVRFRGGSKLNYLGDVLVMALALLSFWCLSQLLVPQPPVAAAAGLVASAGAAAGLWLWTGKNFGRKETTELIEKIKQ